MADDGINHPGAFELRVEQALNAFKRDYYAALDAHTDTQKLSILFFAKHYGISRASLYADHPRLVSQIKQVFAQLKSSREDRLKLRRKKTISELEQEIVFLKKERDRRLAAAVSLSFTKQIERLGPAFKERNQLMLEKQDQAQKIQELERQVRNQARLITSLMEKLNRGEQPI